MAHEIFGERFYSLRKPAWHNLGIVAEQEAGAIETLKVLGEPVITVEPLTVTLPNGTAQELTKQRVILRHPTDDDDAYVPFGIVGSEYQLVTAADVCTVWDEFVGQPVETMGFLKRGSTFFITSKLPSVDVKGDEVEMYLGAVAPNDGQRAASTEVWPLRVVCANTLAWAQNEAISSYRVSHDSGAKVRMGEWLADIYQEAQMTTEVLREAFSILAGVTAEESAIDTVLKAAYPEPKPLRQNAPRDVMERRLKDWTYLRDASVRYRTSARELFDGAGKGSDSDAARGTLWGVYNAVVETEDYRKGWMAGGADAEAARVAEATMFGIRAEAKVRAYEAAKELATA